MNQERSDIDKFSLFMEQHPQQGNRVHELNREGQNLLDSGRIKAAERKFREAIKVCECAIPALNNLALCFQLREDTKRAIRTAHKALECHSADVFAHCTLSECYQEMGQTMKARSHIDRAVILLENPDVPLDKLLKVIEALAKLQWNERIIDIYQSYHEGVGFEDVMDGITWFYVGVAAANLSLIHDALSHFKRAMQEDQRVKLAELYAKALLLVRENKVPRFRFLYQTKKSVGELDPKHPSEEIKPVVATGLWSEREDDDYRHHIVTLLGMWEDTWAEEFLRLIILQPELDDDLKMHAATALIERRAIAEGEEIQMFIGGVKQTVVVNQQEVSPAAVEKFELGLARHKAGDTAASEVSYRKALEIYPNFPEVLVNLANICCSTDRAEEGALLLEKAVALTGSPTAIVNLAAVYVLELEQVKKGQDLISELPIEDLDAGLLPLYYRTL
ncbi:MAG: hypothetical protein U9Q94_02675, partial [Candidatus Bipolaricaulota bacterium]|nr:hypothetical protein [Candidatus Bipolaricaulota bacterium]